ncbi:hypothetical protein U3516DRAFT_266099 [Neocallimastix sp. 'constans']
MLSPNDIDESMRHSFIETDRLNAGYFQWLFSKGTNMTCYIDYMNSLDDQAKLNNKIEVIRVIIYALHRPLKFLFFYWTMLIFILHKFNFKKPVMKIILAHFVLRSMGDLVDKLGDLFPRYYANTWEQVNGVKTLTCRVDSGSSEMHPMKWVITRHLGILLWFTGEICGDWYPLLRTKAVVKNKSIRLVYCACAIFNISKLAIIICHFCLQPTALYDEDGVYRKQHVNYFYFYYWAIHLIIIYSSVLYDISVYYVLKKNVFQVTKSHFGFFKKFKSISEYRILISSVVNMIFLPLVSVTIIAKFYYLKAYDYDDLNFSFDEIRQSVANIPYYMIFIDQIFLIHSKYTQSNVESYSGNSKSYGYNSNSDNNGSGAYKSSNSHKLNSKFQYNTLNENSMNTLNSSTGYSFYSQNLGSNYKPILSSTYSNFNSIQNNNNLLFNTSLMNNTSPKDSNTNQYNSVNSNKNKNINDYNNFNSSKNDWNYLK